MALDSKPRAIWTPGGYVGEVKGNPRCTFMMHHDASEDDEPQSQK